MNYSEIIAELEKSAEVYLNAADHWGVNPTEKVRHDATAAGLLLAVSTIKRHKEKS